MPHKIAIVSSEYNSVIMDRLIAGAQRALKDLERFLRGRGLALNREKTRIVPPGGEVQFLGSKIRARTRRGKTRATR